MARGMMWWVLAAISWTAGAVAAPAPNGVAAGPGRGSGEPPRPATPAHALGCEEAYLNVFLPTGFYYPAGADVEVLDDLHLGDFIVDDVCAFDVGYYKAGAGTTDATVTFYAGSIEDGPPGAVLTSVSLPGLPTGENGFHVEVPAAALTQEIWLGVSFSTADAGLMLADPPWPGASDDWFRLASSGDLFTFGGNPPASFLLGVYASAVPDAVGDLEGLPARPGFLSAPSPNPSRMGVDFTIAVLEEGRVQVQIHDAAGRLVATVKDEVLGPGAYSLRWDGRTARGAPAAPGVYLVRVTLPRFAGTRKVVLMK